ncbi:RNA-directed DNA polymerase from mobile element jockey-like [Elysia marginata]|uniref:RNA-directed DNA polymerase from mobile element jockey-like n=1 Tax=Elysia marginata TaxID=1093978 RepID=A0AAV4IWN8_9GAST|nr:RNA-directed DNA polymerase from mobile element jockey-like [Elysia marginata]
MFYSFVEDRGTGTRNAFFTLSMIIEIAIEMKKDLYLCFIDNSKAFDRVRHDELYKILNSIDIDGKDLRTVRNLYWDQTAATRIDDEISVTDASMEMGLDLNAKKT